MGVVEDVVVVHRRSIRASREGAVIVDRSGLGILAAFAVGGARLRKASVAYGVASAPLPNAPMPPPKPGVNGVAGTAPGSGGAKPKSPPGILDVVAGGWLCAMPNGEGAAEGAGAWEALRPRPRRASSSTHDSTS